MNAQQIFKNIGVRFASRDIITKKGKKKLKKVPVGPLSVQGGHPRLLGMATGRSKNTTVTEA